MQEKELLPHLFRTEYRKIIAVLVRHFGFDQLSLAEDLASDTFLIAAETWGLKGLPENPVAWLYAVAKNKARDQLKHQQVFEKKIKPALLPGNEATFSVDLDLSDENIKDSQLQMMFAIADPQLSVESRIALILRILCGFGLEEIADAFLTSRETVHKRLTRAKEKLRQSGMSFIVPAPADTGARLETVLISLYLLFNEGYYSSSRIDVVRRELCLEAMRLTLLLADNENTCTPAVDALFALMCFHSSRFDARTDENGEIIRYDDQDRSLWNDELIAKGNYYLNKASMGSKMSRYHIEAAIACLHSEKANDGLKWDKILSLYNQLLMQEYSPVTALNRTYALYKVQGKEIAIIEAKKLDLSGSHLYHILLGHLYQGVDDQEAVRHLQTALTLAKTETERKRIRKDLSQLQAVR